MKNHSPQFLKIANAAQDSVPRCSVADVIAKRSAKDNFILIDVREESEFAAGHIPGAMHLSKGIIERDIEKVVPEFDQPLILYCGGGFRSALATQSLMKMGYTNVTSMDGGWTAWQSDS